MTTCHYAQVIAIVNSVRVKASVRLRRLLAISRESPGTHTVDGLQAPHLFSNEENATPLACRVLPLVAVHIGIRMSVALGQTSWNGSGLSLCSGEWALVRESIN